MWLGLRNHSSENGGGKGDPEKWIFPVKPGRIMFELTGVDEDTAKHIARLIGVQEKLID